MKKMHRITTAFAFLLALGMTAVISEKVLATEDDSSIMLAEDKISDGEEEQNAKSIVTIVRHSDGKLYYTVNGKADLSYTGYANINGDAVSLYQYKIVKGAVDTSYEGLYKVDGVWRYYRDGKFQDTTTGFATDMTRFYASGRKQIYRYRVEKGLINFHFNGFAETNNARYYKDGRWMNTYTGYANNTQGLLGEYEYYVRNGAVDEDYEGLYKVDGVWRYYRYGKFQTTTTGFATDMTRYNSTRQVYRYRIEKGLINFHFTAFAETGNLRYYKDGRWMNSYSGIASADNENYFYVLNGQIQKNYTGQKTVTIGFHYCTWNIQNGKVTNKVPESFFAAVEFDNIDTNGNYINNTICRVGDYYFKQTSASKGYINSISTTRNGTYRKMPYTYSYGMVSDGKTVYYVRNSILCSYDIGSGKETSLCSLSKYLAGGNSYYDPWFDVSYAYGDWVYVTLNVPFYDSDVVFITHTFKYDLKTKTIGKIRDDCEIIEYYGDFVVGRNFYMNGDAIYNVMIYKIDKDGTLSPYKTLSENCYSCFFNNGRLGFYEITEYAAGRYLLQEYICDYDGGNKTLVSSGYLN